MHEDSLKKTVYFPFVPGTGRVCVVCCLVGVDHMTLFIQQEIVVMGGVRRSGSPVGHHRVPLPHPTLRNVDHHPVEEGAFPRPCRGRGDVRVHTQHGKGLTYKEQEAREITMKARSQHIMYLHRETVYKETDTLLEEISA